MIARDRISVLDGLRALAICLVLARHSTRLFWPDVEKPFLDFGAFDAGTPLLNGWVGVDLFFVLSGFLITRQLLKVYNPSGFALKDVLHYLKRRVLRIVPAYYLVLTLVCLGFFPRYPQVSPETVWGWRYIYHLLFLQDYWPSNINVVFWSLAIEMKFYLIAPFLVAMLMKLKGIRARLAVFTGLMVLMVALRYMTVKFWLAPFDDYYTYFTFLRNRFHLNLDGLLAGVLCAFLYNDQRAMQFIGRHANKCFWFGTALLSCLIFPVPLLDRGVMLFQKTLLPTCLAAGFGSLMLGLLGGSIGGSLFSAKLPAFIARISYSLYLVHQLLLFPALVLTYALLEPLVHDLPPSAWWALSLPAFFSMSFILAFLLYKYVEKPFMEGSLSFKRIFSH